MLLLWCSFQIKTLAMHKIQRAHSLIHATKLELLTIIFVGGNLSHMEKPVICIKRKNDEREVRAHWHIKVNSYSQKVKSTKTSLTQPPS